MNKEIKHLELLISAECACEIAKSLGMDYEKNTEYTKYVHPERP